MDMIINLYAPMKSFPLPSGIRIVRALPFEAPQVVAFVKQNFSTDGGWSEEIKGPLHLNNPTIFLALRNKSIVGFCAYDATAKGFLGPLGVSESERGHGIGAALCASALCALKEDGYAYAIVGWVGPQEFYSKNFGAVALNNSFDQSVYSRMIKF